MDKEHGETMNALGNHLDAVQKELENVTAKLNQFVELAYKLKPDYTNTISEQSLVIRELRELAVIEKMNHKGMIKSVLYELSYCSNTERSFVSEVISKFSLDEEGDLFYDKGRRSNYIYQSDFKTSLKQLKEGK